MTDPIDLLKERLKEIEAIDCNDVDFIRYKNKYKYTIKFLEIYQIGGFFRRKLNNLEEKCVRDLYNNNIVSKATLKKEFFITNETFNRIVNEK